MDDVIPNDIPLETLLADEPMLTLPETAERLGVVITRVHDLLGANKLIAHVIDGKRHIPEALFHEGSHSTGKFVPGLITLLKDGGYTDEEILRYLFTEDETLPGRPVDALHGQLAREVLRRAQAMAL
ncbi:transcriptional regulator [Corynebacterium humireducens NBRC 106098 = DSM 45392]|uniref:Transcriptional regulator n=2 Tax=Corynebacterium humireducens TaxID=1223514 RepID=A0A0B5D3S0_9CORY|nr:transcriptional regulator [Corynebacterium humireducens NBRC 106098 = DSM 45392]